MKLGRNAGFTLLEMLLALTLLSMIVGAILGGFHIGKRVWETGRSYETVGEIEEAARAIESQLARAMPIALPKSNNAQVVAFEGEPDRCRFLALSEGDAQWGGPILTEIGLGDEGANVIISTHVFRPSEGLSTPVAQMRNALALRDAAYLELSYFGEIEQGHPPVWTDRWNDRASLPLLVAVRFGGKSEGRVVDASFTVALRQR